MLIKALDLATGNLQTELKKWLSLAEFDKNEKVAAVTRIYNELGVREYAAEKINYYFKNAYQALDKLDIHNQQLEELRAYADYLTHRDR